MSGIRAHNHCGPVYAPSRSCAVVLLECVKLDTREKEQLLELTDIQRTGGKETPFWLI